MHWITRRRLSNNNGALILNTKQHKVKRKLKDRERERERGRAQCSVDMKSGEESGVFIDKEEWAVSRIII